MFSSGGTRNETSVKMATTPPGVRLPRAHVDDDGGSPRLIGGHCDRCGVTAYPVPAQCPGCLGPFALRPLSATGVLYTYSVIHVGTPDRPAPYIVGYVDLPEGARLFAHVAETDEERLRPGMAVRLMLRRLNDAVPNDAVPDGAEPDCGQSGGGTEPGRQEAVVMWVPVSAEAREGHHA
jgi:uncharacterized OB-fold protein